MNHACPHCGESLRHARMTEHEAPRASRRMAQRWYKVCPHCQGQVEEMRHPAFAGDWRWMMFTAPGMLLAVLAIFAWPPLMWLALPALAGGLVWTVVYTVRERLRWVRFRRFEADAQTSE